jgi:F-type H+-transporting ATPase subunit delta
MIPGSLARRYARALIGLAQSPAQRDKFAQDLEAFADLVRQKDDLGAPISNVLVAERFALSDRTKLVDALCRRIGADPMVVKFLHHVLGRGRMNGAADITRAYRRMADDVAGRVNAEITSATALGPDVVAEIKTALEKATGKQVVATTAVDPELIGGVVAKVGSYVVDGSVRTALAQMKAALAAH